jgi:hypothetical protein
VVAWAFLKKPSTVPLHYQPRNVLDVFFAGVLPIWTYIYTLKMEVKGRLNSKFELKAQVRLFTLLFFAVFLLAELKLCIMLPALQSISHLPVTTLNHPPEAFMLKSSLCWFVCLFCLTNLQHSRLSPRI